MKELETLVAAGALLSIRGEVYPVGAARRIGGSIVWAQQGAQHQGHVHRADGITLRSVSPDMIDWVNADGSLYGTLERMDDEEAREHLLPDWRRFMDQPENRARWLEFFDDEAKSLMED